MPPPTSSATPSSKRRRSARRATRAGAKARPRSCTSCPSRASPIPRPRAPWRSCATSDIASTNVRTIRTYRVDGPAAALPRLIQRLLANDAVEQAIVGPLPLDHLGQGQHLRVSPGRRADPGARRRVARGPEPLRPALAEPRRDAGDPGPFRGARPRPDRLRARDARPDLERALLAQDAQGPHRLRGPDDRQPAQGDDLRRDARAGLRLAGERLQRQCRRHPVRRRARRLLQGRDAQSPVGHRSLRRVEYGPGRGHPRCARDRARGQADLQHRRVLRGTRPTSTPSACRPGCCTPSACSRGSSRACATTATAWAFRRSTAPWRSTPATWPIPWSSAARSASCRGAWRRSTSRPATGSSPSAVGPAATASTGRPSARPS